MEGADPGVIGKYRLIAELGHGGMAQVFLALARGPAGFNKLVVIKQIRDNLAEDPEFLTMFLDEARLAARLNHPNVVQTNEVGEDNRRYFIAMEYLEGQPLNRIIQRLQKEGKTFETKLYVRVLIDALAGLHDAHELCDFDGSPLHVVHRDMTPHNVFVTYSGQVKVVDFGIAKAAGGSAETRTGVLKGKVSYMAPEQAMGERVDRRADIFSVGVMLWEALAGKRLFRGMSDVAVLQKIVSGDVPKPSSVKPDVPKPLEVVCMKALAHRRDDRHATAADLATDLEAALEAMGEKPQLREVGKLAAQLFAVEQAKIKSLVEAEIANVRSSGEFPNVTRTGSKLPIIDAHTSMGDGVGSGSGSGSIRASRASLTNEGSGSISRRMSIEGERISSPSTSSLTSASAMLAADATSAPQPKSNKKIIAVAGALVIGGVIAVALFAWPKGGPAAATTATQQVSAANVLLIESEPPGATVTEDGKVLGETPISVSIEAGQKGRKFVLARAGYAAYTIFQPPEGVKLPVAKLAPTAPQPTAQTPSAAPTAEPKDKETKEPKKVVVAQPPPPPPPKATAAPAVKPLDINLAR